jgi:hypothetical protein
MTPPRRKLARVVLTSLGLLATTASAATAAPAPAAAASVLPAPGTPVPTDVTTTGVTLSWAASAGPVASYSVQVIDEPLGLFHTVGTPATTTFTHTGLVPDRVHIYRIVAQPVSGSDHVPSAPSGLAYVTTRPLPDAQPPSRPGRPTAQSIGTVSATLTFTPSADNNRVAGYTAQRQVDGGWTDVATNNVNPVYLRNLSPGSAYTVAVVAIDANGNVSTRSDPVTFTTRATQPQPTCTVNLLTFGRQYQLTVTIENMTAATVLENWSVRFTMPAAHRTSYSFNTTLSRDGDQATAAPVAYNTRIGPGSGTTFGIIATYPAGSPLPSGFLLHPATVCP